MLNYVTTGICIFSLLHYVNARLSEYTFTLSEVTSSDLLSALNLSVFFISIIFIVYKMSKIISNYVFKILEDVGGNHVFNITRGDKQTIQRIEKDEEQRKNHLIINLIITIIINIACGVITNMLF